MRLLITNDDGIDSALLHALVGTLRAAGHDLYLAAPKQEQSWVGASKSRHRAVHSTTIDRGFGCPTWIIDGSPGDCVNIALAHLVDTQPDVSLRLSTLTTLLLLILGLPLASWLAFSSWRWKFFVEAVVALPIVLPPTVLGFYVLIAIGPHSPIGQAYEAITGRGLPFSFQGLLVASVLYSLPFAVQPFTAAISTVDQRLIEASWCSAEAGSKPSSV